jgi:hypothetical protein
LTEAKREPPRTRMRRNFDFLKPSEEYQRYQTEWIVCEFAVSGRIGVVMRAT